MARGLNKVQLIGNLGDAPETRFLANDVFVANFSVATTEKRKTAAGDWEDETEWHRCVVFGRQAEICRDYLHKGSKIYLEGKLRTRSWEDSEGRKRYTTEIVGRSLIMLDGRSGQNAPGEHHGSDPGADDDLPF